MTQNWWITDLFAKKYRKSNQSKSKPS